MTIGYHTGCIVSSAQTGRYLLKDFQYHNPQKQFFSFNVIGKLETMSEDFTFISERANLNLNVEKFPWANKKSSVDDVSLQYFKQIDANSILKLYNIYKIDFEMFDYDANDYVQRQ